LIWVKENFEKLTLLIVAFAMLACGVLLAHRTLNFSESFREIGGEVTGNLMIEPVDIADITEAFELMESPQVWTDFAERSLFSAERYIERDGQLVKPHAGDFLLPITNDWLDQYDLDVLDTSLKERDMDLDGFTVLEEFHARSSPIDNDSHPAYWTKLRLKQFFRQRFRLIFSAYTGNPSIPESLTFQLNTLDLRKPTQFLKIGDRIAGTKFRILGFEKKTRMKASGLIKDVSELTVVNIENGSSVVLVLERITDSPDSFALFKYLWDGSEFSVKQRGSFKLKPDEEKIFELVEIGNTMAIIKDMMTGEKHQVPVLE
jgi:hypothetical protein